VFGYVSGSVSGSVWCRIESVVVSVFRSRLGLCWNMFDARLGLCLGMCGVGLGLCLGLCVGRVWVCVWV
jgi:hypothetical protein